MALRYDFDMVGVSADGLPEAFDDLAATGMKAEKLAMFRDPATVAALKQADPAVQTFFTESDFALQSFDSGAPPNRFLKRDEDARLAVIEKLTINLSTHNLDGANWGGFTFPDFMEALGKAQVLDDDSLLAPTSGQKAGDPEVAAAYAASAKLQKRRKLALTGMILGLVLLLIVASQLLS